MGMFSWITSDTHRAITVESAAGYDFPVYALTPDGEVIKEEHYSGYGRFGGNDIYALVARWNNPEECNGDDEHDRQIGIRIACYDEDNASIKYPIKLVEDPSITYEEAEPAMGDPNQGWGSSEEEDEYDDEWY